MSDLKSSKPGKKAPAVKTAKNAVPALGIDALKELALNLHWSWNHMADPLWEALDSYLWHSTLNPWVILQTVSDDKVKALLATPDFQELLSTLLQHKRKFFGADAWFQKTHPGAAISTIAYFSMEFMLTEALPIYSGGLGNVAGDQMKSASDLGVPVVGVGLLWGQGYFRQDFDVDGNRPRRYPTLRHSKSLAVRMDALHQSSASWRGKSPEIITINIGVRATARHDHTGRLEALSLVKPAGAVSADNAMAGASGGM